MVSWLHIIWIAPSFTVAGLLLGAFFFEPMLRDVEDALASAIKASNDRCRKCDVQVRAEAAEADKKALIEEIATNRRTNNQLRGMVERLQAKVWRQTP